jgi:hypothetical protein
MGAWTEVHKAGGGGVVVGGAAREKDGGRGGVVVVGGAAREKDGGRGIPSSTTTAEGDCLMDGRCTEVIDGERGRCFPGSQQRRGRA